MTGLPPGEFSLTSPGTKNASQVTSPTSWSDTSIVVPVPSGAASGNVIVTVSGSPSNGMWFNVPSTWSNRYAFRRIMTISHTQVPNTDQTNFPVLISGTYSYLATAGNGGGVTSSNGYDIIFTSDAAGMNNLPFEQESYNPSSGAVNYWVRVPILSHTVDTVIYMFYGNSGVTTDQSNKTAVWDSNYKAVWHLPNGSTLSASDSTSNGNNGSLVNTPTALSGQIDGAAGLNGSSQYIRVASSNSFKPTSGITLSGWVYLTANTNWSHLFSLDYRADGTWNTPYNAYSLGFYNNTNEPYANMAINGTMQSVGPSSALSLNSWHHLATTYDGSTMRLFVDGSDIANTSASGTLSYNSSLDLALGQRSPYSSYEYLTGDLDELRISAVPRSADWIATEYKNQSSPSTFYSLGGANPPSIAVLSPASGPVATVVTITGSFFGSTQGTSTVTFSGVTASPTSWSDTSIVVPVPTGATSGSVVVTVGGFPSNPAQFSVPGTTYNGYGFRRAVTIDHTKVSNSDQTNFPVLISGTYSYLATIPNGGNVVSPNGYDIVFTSDFVGQNLLTFERDAYNASNGAIAYWVKIPTLSHTADTVIYMLYGNSTVTTDQSNKTAVWDSNYKGVWHLANGTTLNASDSTANGNNLTISGATPTSGRIDGGAAFNGTSSILSLASAPVASTPLTISAWINSSSSSGVFAGTLCDIGCSIWNGYYLAMGGGAIAYEVSNNNFNGSSGSASLNTWHHIVGVFASSTSRTIYIDGVAGTANTSNSTPASAPNDFYIGAARHDGTIDNYFSGAVDEVRISNIARSADWISTEFNNQSNPSSFYSIDSQAVVGSPVIASVSPTSGGASTSVTLAGGGFGSTQGTSSVKFNGTPASPTSWSSTSITVPVPSAATTGNIVVGVSSLTSNGFLFTVTGGLSGTVTRQSDGTAISGATVQALQNRIVTATTTTASDGTYTISNLATGEYDVQFSASGFGSALQPAVAIPAAGATLNQALATSGTISGQITQSNGTTAITGATITALQASEVRGTTTSNGSGNYSISNLGAGSYEVEVSASGFVNQGLSGVSVTSGITTTENFSLNAVGTQPISYVYDQLGRLTAAIDQAGNVAGYAYDAVGNILSISRGSAQQLSIISFAPNSGSVGNPVTIYGTAFSPTPSQNTVKFNGTTATVTTATATSLTVSVPSGATTGTVSVTTSAGTATSSANFTVATAGAGQPTISSFSPSIGVPGTSVSISGTNFDTTSANDKVKYNVAPAIPSTSTTTSLSVTVPKSATSGHLLLATPAGTVSSTSDFFVPSSPFTASNVGYTNRVSLGGSQTVTISTAGQIGLLVFDGSAGHRVSLLTLSNTMTSTGGATTISINNPSGVSLASQSVTTSTPFIAAQNLLVTGTYTIVVQPASSATGSITVTIYDVPADVSGSITIGGSSVPISISTPGQGATLTFAGTSGQQVTVHATSNTIGTVTVTLASPIREAITSTNSNASNFDLTSSTLPAAGAYYVIVSPSQGSTGGITISLTSP